MAIREGRWDCRQCGEKGNLGRHQECPACGAVREDGTKFYLPDDAPEVMDDDELRRAKVGPDWACLHCSTTNRADQSDCQQCGAPRTAKQETPEERPESKPLAVETSTPNAKPLARIVGLSAAALVALLFLVWLFTPIRKALVVTGHTWERKIAVQELRTVTEEDWSVPSGGREKSRWRAIHHYDKVVDHYETRYKSVREVSHYETKYRSERVQTGTRRVRTGSRDLGNGYFEDVYSSEPVYETQQQSYQEPVYVTKQVPYQEAVYRDEPVYRTKYRYDVEKWQNAVYHPATGRDKKPRWPDVVLAKGSPPYNAGQQREAGRHETYIVELKDPKTNKPYTKSLDMDRWQRLEVGQNVYVRMMRWGWITDIKTLEE